MRYDDIDMQGKFYIEEYASKPAFTSADKRRLIYVADVQQGDYLGTLYYGHESDWGKVCRGDRDLFLKSNAADEHSGTIQPT